MDPMRPLLKAVDPETGLPRCTAKSKQGRRCKNRPIPGGPVCKFHGGAAPQVKKAAQLRLLELVEPAIATMAKELVNKDSSPHARLRAAENILDRTGHGRKVEVGDSDAARQLLLQRLTAMTAEKAQEVDEEELTD